jgi:hypothetical protein
MKIKMFKKVLYNINFIINIIINFYFLIFYFLTFYFLFFTIYNLRKFIIVIQISEYKLIIN